MKKSLSTALTLFLCLLTISTISLAHSGRTDASGGHRDNKNVSGLGSYHYHHGYPAHLHSNGVCPYSTPSAPAATSSAPAATPLPAENKTESPKLLALSPGDRTPIPAFTSAGLKTDKEKALFLDHYVAIITNPGMYHTIDCEEFSVDKFATFLAIDMSQALAQGYTPCPKCHK